MQTTTHRFTHTESKLFERHVFTVAKNMFCNAEPACRGRTAPLLGSGEPSCIEQRKPSVEVKSIQLRIYGSDCEDADAPTPFRRCSMRESEPCRGPMTNVPRMVVLVFLQSRCKNAALANDAKTRKKEEKERRTSRSGCGWCEVFAKIEEDVESWRPCLDQLSGWQEPRGEV